jgi:hypothetical protein
LHSVVNKAVINALIPKDDWVSNHLERNSLILEQEKIKNGLHTTWSTKKLLSQQNITEIEAEKLTLDPDNEENQEINADEVLITTFLISFVWAYGPNLIPTPCDIHLAKQLVCNYKCS